MDLSNALGTAFRCAWKKDRPQLATYHLRLALISKRVRTDQRQPFVLCFGSERAQLVWRELSQQALYRADMTHGTARLAHHARGKLPQLLVTAKVSAQLWC